MDISFQESLLHLLFVSVGEKCEEKNPNFGPTLKKTEEKQSRRFSLNGILSIHLSNEKFDSFGRRMLLRKMFTIHRRIKASNVCTS